MILAHQLWKPRDEKKTKDSENILLLHGMGGTGMIWRPIAAGLEEEFQVMSPDQRGHGKSLIPSVSGGRDSVTYRPLDYGRDLVETLDAVNFHPVWVVGHSMGVRSACALAHLEPDWVRGMVLIDLGFSGPAGGGLGDGLASFLRILPMRFASRAEARTFMSEKCPDPSIAQYLLAVSVPTREGGITFPFDKAALIETIHAARDASVREWVREAGERGIPVLVLRGAESQVWSREEYLREKEALQGLDSIRFEEMPGTGHGLPFEKRREFLERFKQWITTNT